MEIKPKIGILFFTSGWFRDVGLQDASSGITAEMEEIGRSIVERLTAFLDPVYGGVLFTVEEAGRAAGKIAEEDVEGLIVAPLMWCEDEILRAALKKLPGLPLLVCTFFPYRTLSSFVDFQEMLKGSGSVGSLQMSGLLRREGYRYRAVTGYYEDPLVYEEIRDHCRAFALSRMLKNTRCGVLPFRCEQMSTTYVDEFELRNRYGVELKYLEIAAVREVASAMAEEEVDKFRSNLVDEGYRIEVDDRNLREGIRYALALDAVTRRHDLQILAMNDVIEEMHDRFGLRPCLTNPDMNERGVVVSMEADVAAGVTMFILRNFMGRGPLYTELFTVDLEENAFLMGHAGYHDPYHHDPDHGVRIVPDVEYENSDPLSGACIYFKLKPGPVTAVNAVYTGEKLRWSVFEGESVPGPPKMNGNCHLLMKVPMPIPAFYRHMVEAGVSQHIIVIPGHGVERLERLCSWLNIDFMVVR